MSRLRFAWGSLLLIACGCGTQYQISGTVTYDGKLVPCGEIVLTPDPDTGNSGPGLLLQIKDGKYQTIDKRGQVGGAYIARISGYKAPDPGPSMSRYGYPIFMDYVTKVELARGDTVHDFEVPRQPALNLGPPIGGLKK